MLISEICEGLIFDMLRKHQRIECNEDSYLVILHLSRVELHCKLQEKLQRHGLHTVNPVQGVPKKSDTIEIISLFLSRS
jgi:hypothetical protein